MLNENLQRMYVRLRSLLGAGNVDLPAIQTEISDLRRNLLANGQTEAQIAERTAQGVEGF
jgi:hypothetical protein